MTLKEQHPYPMLVLRPNEPEMARMNTKEVGDGAAVNRRRSVSSF